MEALLEQTFESRAELVEAVRTQAIGAGFVTVIGSSHGDRCIKLKCDQGGVYCDRVNARPGEKRRKTSTRRVNCSFFISASRSVKRTSDGRWRFGKCNLVHTGHTPDVANLITHPGKLLFKCYLSIWQVSKGDSKC